jgi:uncharacterized protein (TIGR02099 family)
MSELLSSSPTPAPLSATSRGSVPAPPAALPSRSLRWGSRLIALVWWPCLILAILFGLAWGVLHGLIVPRIGDLRPTLENRLTQDLGVSVRIGAISAQFNLLAPSFELLDVRLQDNAGRDALVLSKIIATVSPRSMLQLGFEQLVIEQPQLDVRRNAQGQIVVAGFALTQTTDSTTSSPVADWIFSQRELAVRSGSVRWTDELRGQPPLELSQVDVVLRNPRQLHQLRIDATPPTDWGERFSLVGDVSSPLFAKAGQWTSWAGQVYANFARVDVSQLKRYADFSADISKGNGALRLWGQLDKGVLTQVTADMALADVDVKLSPELQPLVMPTLSGRLSGQALEGGLRVATQDLAFRTQDGIVWPGGNVSFLQTGRDGKSLAYGELSADRLDLAALAQIMDRLPVGTATHTQIRSLAPQGQVEVVQANWKGQLSAPTSYAAQGRVKGLAVAAQMAQPTATASVTTGSSTATTIVGRPGVSGATVDFKLSQQGGEATIAISKGALTLPGIFEEPFVPLDSLNTKAKWTLQGDKIDVQVNDLKFANADAQGEAKVSWHTADPTKSRSKSRFPGVLDLQGSLSRAEGTSVHRYLPMGIAKPAREYVRNAVVKGTIKSAKFNVKGDVFDMPFADPKLGEFRIAVQVASTHFAYVPPSVQPEGSIPWPAITQLNGELVFDRKSMAINAATGRLGDSLQITQADVSIADLSSNATVVVRAQARGALTDMLGVVNSSPLLDITKKSLQQAQTTGNADLKLYLNLPINTIAQSKVAGTVTLAGNDIQITPETPLLARSSGVVTFNETGFYIKDAQSTLLGGEARIEGGSRSGAGPTDASLAFSAQGIASAQGLREANYLGFVSRLGQNASGSAAYTATLVFRAGSPEIAVNSNLQGMALSFPAPLAKAADTPLLLHYENTLMPASLVSGQKLQDQLKVDIGTIANIVYVRDISSKEPRVLRGGIGIGLLPGESAPATEDGVIANINLAQVDLDAWEKVLSGITGVGLGPASSVASTASYSVATAAPNAANTSAASGYIPTTIAVRARELKVAGRTLNNVVVGGSRDGLTWRANLDAGELNGYAEYRQASETNAGRVYARLARLSLAPAAASEIEAALDNQPSAIPALDIVVEDFELRGKKFGRIEIEAINRGAQGSLAEGGVREWRLSKFNAIMPEAQFSATGNWAAIDTGAGPRVTRPATERRRTVMDFKLDIANAGDLLKRIGLDKVVAKGNGKMEGQVAWLGSPLSLDYPSMSGKFNVKIESGQFLKTDPGIAKLLGVLSLQSLPRRLTLDFRDVFSDGFSFDSFGGDIKIDQGVAFTNNLRMSGVNAVVAMEGSADLAKETQNLRVVVVPEVNAGTASIITAIINPVVGLSTFLAQLILRRPFIDAITQEFQIDGSWTDPKINKVDRKIKVVTPSQTTSSAPESTP